MKEVEDEYELTSSANTSQGARPKSQQVFATESLLAEEIPLHDTTLEQTDFREASRISERQSNDISMMNDPKHTRDVQYITEMAKLQENALLWICFKYFLLPFYVLGLFGCFFPYVYAFVPVHEADLCICSFYN